MPQSTPSSPRSSRRWRIVRRAAIVPGILIVLFFVAVQIIFQTSVPRNLVLSAIEKQIGLRVSAQSLSTGFFGHTALDDVTVALPLADKPFLSVPELTLDHTWLISLLLGRSFEIQRININQPNLEISQDSTGAWNLQQALLLIAQNTKSSQNNEVPVLPALNIQDVTLTITDGQSRSSTIQHLDFTGEPDGLLVWEIRAEAAGHLKLDGKIAPGDRWAHAVSFELDDLDGWLSPWIPSWPASAKIAARWTGQIVSGELQGQLDIQQAAFNALGASGSIDIATIPDGVTFRPQGITLRNDGDSQLDAQVISGDITINSAGVQTKNLGLQFAQGRATLEADYSFAQRCAALHAAWNDLALPATVVQSGDLQLTYNSDHGSPNFNGTLESQGASPSGNWDASISIDGSGNTAQTIAATVTAQKLVVNSAYGKSLNLSGLITDFAASAQGISLRDVRLGESRPLAGRGGLDYTKRLAWFSLDGRGWPIPGESNRTVDADVSFWATPKRFHLEQLYLNSGMFNAFLTGDYVARLPKPVKAQLYISENPQMGPTPNPAPPFGGNLQAQFDLNGTLNPIDIAFDGSANGEDLYYRQRSFGDLDLQIDGFLRNNQITLQSQNVQLFGGDWTLNGQWPVRNSLLRIDELSVQHLSLPLASGNTKIAGTLDGKWAIDVHDLAPGGISIDGSATVHDLGINGNPNLRFDQIDMPNIHVGNGWAKISPITLTRNFAKSAGKANLRLVTMLQDPSLVWVNVDAKSWPVQTPDGRGAALLSATGKLQIDLAERAALGRMKVDADALWDSQTLGNVQLNVNADRRQFQIRNVQVKTLNGTATGDADFDLDAPYQTQAQLTWKDLNLTALRSFWPQLAPLTGKTGGSLKVHPATTPRPLGPLAIDLAIDSDQIAVGGKHVGNLTAAAFAGPGRFVLEDTSAQPSAVEFAGGTIHFWGRVTRHPGDIYQTLLQLNLQNLDIDELLPPGSKVEKTPGLLSGQITVIGTPDAPTLSFGQGALTLAQSDLAGTGPIAFVYNLMHILHNAKKPVGSGTINFTIQDENATITGMRYFDRGTELVINGDIDELRQFPHSPVDLIVVGSARPLKSIDLPGIGDFDAAISAIQSRAIAVRVTGQFDKPVEKSILFKEIGSEMLNFLFGQTSAGNGSQ